MDAMRQNLIDLGCVVGDNDVFIALLHWNVGIMVFVQFIQIICIWREGGFSGWSIRRRIIYIFIGCALGVVTGIIFSLFGHMIKGFEWFITVTISLVVYFIFCSGVVVKNMNNEL